MFRDFNTRNIPFFKQFIMIIFASELYTHCSYDPPSLYCIFSDLFCLWLVTAEQWDKVMMSGKKRLASSDPSGNLLSINARRFFDSKWINGTNVADITNVFNYGKWTGRIQATALFRCTTCTYADAIYKNVVEHIQSGVCGPPVVDSVSLFH